MKPRKYQLDSIEKIKKSFKEGKRHVAIAISGGGGKSLVAKMILDMAKAKGSKIGFFSYRKLLVEQIKTYNIPNCDIGTLQKFGKSPTEMYDLVIFDESWGENSKLKNNINSKYSVTLSGTPIGADGFPLEFDEIIDGIQTVDLIDMGLAKPLKVLATSKVDTDKLKKVAGDYSPKDSYDLMSKSEIVKDVVKVYNQYSKDRKTMIFGINTQHCEDIKKEFLNAGIKCETVHSKKNNNDDTLNKFDKREIDVIISVSMLNVGYDNVSVNSIILARPTKSPAVLMQTIWRGTRLNPEKKDDYCLVLDLANCIKDTNFHPLQRFDFNRTKQEKFTKCKECGSKTKLINRKIEIIDKYEYVVKNTYQCESCAAVQEVDNLKCANLSICEGCGNEFQSQGSLQMKKDDKGIEFNMVCICGHERLFRGLEYSKEELQELKLNDALNGATWKDVSIILKAECKKNNYHWKYSERLIETLKNKKIEPKQAIEKIKMVLRTGQKLAALNYA